MTKENDENTKHVLQEINNSSEEQLLNVVTDYMSTFQGSKTSAMDDQDFSKMMLLVAGLLKKSDSVRNKFTQFCKMI